MELWRSQSGAKRTTERERAETSTTRRVLAEQPQLIHFVPKKNQNYKGQSNKYESLPCSRALLVALASRAMLVALA